MNYFTEIKIKVKILMYFAQYYSLLAALPALFITALFGGFVAAFFEALTSCKEDYNYFRWKYRGF